MKGALERQFPFGRDAGMRDVYKSSRRTTTAIVIYFNNDVAARISSKNTQISLFPKLRDQHCPRYTDVSSSLCLSFARVPPFSLPLSSFLYSSFCRCSSCSSARVSRRDQAETFEFVRVRCAPLCVPARANSYMCARPVTRINPVYPHVKCTVKRKWPLRTGGSPTLSFPSRSRAVASRASLPFRFPPLFSSTLWELGPFVPSSDRFSRVLAQAKTSSAYVYIPTLDSGTVRKS